MRLAGVGLVGLTIARFGTTARCGTRPFALIVMREWAICTRARAFVKPLITLTSALRALVAFVGFVFGTLAPRRGGRPVPAAPPLRRWRIDLLTVFSKLSINRLQMLDNLVRCRRRGVRLE